MYYHINYYRYEGNDAFEDAFEDDDVLDEVENNDVIFLLMFKI